MSIEKLFKNTKYKKTSISIFIIILFVIIGVFLYHLWTSDNEGFQSVSTTPPATTKPLIQLEPDYYDKIIQKYEGTPLYNWQPVKNITTTVTEKTTNNITTTTTVTEPDDIINYYGNLILDKDGIEKIMNNEYLDDLINNVKK
jgi:hypothetical protein